ncbi:MAG: toprim domain-containing protein, partial [Deltaproteobacteria bacterium]|nr:toprim domain-containing protein [Deltaproteobacteria bacterium]
DIVPFEEAVNRLSGDVPKGKTTSGQINGADESVRGGALSRPVLLKNIFDFYVRTFSEAGNAGVEYLKSRRLTTPELFKTFNLGFANGTLLQTLNTETKNQLKEIGILTKTGKEFFHNCVVFPLVDPQGNIINLYGRHISKNQHLYLPGELKGLFYAPKEIRQTAGSSTDSIIITEGILDALTLHQAGWHNVLPIYGVNGLTADHLSFIKQNRIKRVTLCLDGDETGRNAEPKLKEKLESLGVTVSAVQLPDGLDVNDFFSKNSKEDFALLLNKALPDGSNNQYSISNIQSIDGGYIFTYDQHKYRTLGMNLHGLDRLKANIKISRNGSFHIDTLDLYSSRARSNFIESSAKLLKVEEKQITREVNQLIETLEDKRLEIIAGGQKEKPFEMSETEREEALQFLKNPDLLNEIQNDFDKCGYIGEETARLFGYLTATSRFLTQPLGALIVSRSAAGKSFLQDAVCRFVLPEDLQRYTRITG